MSEVTFCIEHGLIPRSACHAMPGDPLSCSFCLPPGNGNVREVVVFAKTPLRRYLEGYLAAHGWEVMQVDHGEGVRTWYAPSAGYEDGIDDLTTLEAVARQLLVERREYEPDVS